MLRLFRLQPFPPTPHTLIINERRCSVPLFFQLFLRGLAETPDVVSGYVLGCSWLHFNSASSSILGYRTPTLLSRPSLLFNSRSKNFGKGRENRVYNQPTLYIDTPKDKTWAFSSNLFLTHNVSPHPLPSHPTYPQHSAREQKPPPHPNRTQKTTQTKKPTHLQPQTWDEAPQPHPSPQKKTAKVKIIKETDSKPALF